MFGALPSRIASRSTGSASPSISRNTMPGTSVTALAPWRRAIRRVTRRLYSSSSLVPRIAWRIRLTAEITIAASSASPNESTRMSSGNTSCASRSTKASANSTARKPARSMNGSRSAASAGGSTALSNARNAATTNAAPVDSSATPGTISAATQIDAAETAQETSVRRRRSLGVAGSQRTCSPYGVAPGSAISGSFRRVGPHRPARLPARHPTIRVMAADGPPGAIRGVLGAR